MAPKVHFTISDKADCEEVLVLIKHYWPGLFVEEPVPEPTPAPTTTPAPPSEAPEIKSQASEPVTEPPVTVQSEDYTRDMLQNMIRGYLTPLKGDDETMTAAKKGLIDVLLEVAGVGSSATVPEEKMNETYLAVQAHIEAQPF